MENNNEYLETYNRMIESLEKEFLKRWDGITFLIYIKTKFLATSIISFFYIIEPFFLFEKAFLILNCYGILAWGSMLIQYLLLQSKIKKIKLKNAI